MSGNQTLLDPPESGSAQERASSGRATERKTMTFSFDKSYWSAGPRDEPGYCSQQTLFDDLGKELLDHGFAGFNACILACEFCIRVTGGLVWHSPKDGQTGACYLYFSCLHTDLRNRIWKIVQVCVKFIPTCRWTLLRSSHHSLPDPTPWRPCSSLLPDVVWWAVSSIITCFTCHDR